MLKCNLAVLLAERGLKISKVSQDTKISRTTLTALASNHSQGIQLDTLDTLCTYLRVSPKEFFCFVPYDFSVAITDNSTDNYGHNFGIEITVSINSSSRETIFLQAYSHNSEDNLDVDFYAIEPTIDDDEPNGNINAINRFIKPLPPVLKTILQNDIIWQIANDLDKDDVPANITWPEGLFS